jgi:preprotein translocase subunit SecG
MLTLIFVLCIVSAVLLIGLVLIQPGKGDMMSGMGGLNLQFNAAFGSSQATNILTKATWGFAGAILILSLTANVFLTSEVSADSKKAATEKVEIKNSLPATGFQAAPSGEQLNQEVEINQENSAPAEAPKEAE